MPSIHNGRHLNMAWEAGYCPLREGNQAGRQAGRRGGSVLARLGCRSCLNIPWLSGPVNSHLVPHLSNSSCYHLRKSNMCRGRRPPSASAGAATALQEPWLTPQSPPHHPHPLQVIFPLLLIFLPFLLILFTSFPLLLLIFLLLVLPSF